MSLGDFKLAERGLNLDTVEEPSWFDSLSWGSVGDTLISGVSKIGYASDVVANSKVIYDNFGKTPDELRRENTKQDLAKKPAPSKTMEKSPLTSGVNQNLLLVGGGLVVAMLIFK